jgi:hypothetical protein
MPQYKRAFSALLFVCCVPTPFGVIVCVSVCVDVRVSHLAHGVPLRCRRYSCRLRLLLRVLPPLPPLQAATARALLQQRLWLRLLHRQRLPCPPTPSQ